jgi:hypothetical protein
MIQATSARRESMPSLNSNSSSITVPKHDLHDLALADSGRKRIDWALSEATGMPHHDVDSMPKKRTRRSYCVVLGDIERLNEDWTS